MKRNVILLSFFLYTLTSCSMLNNNVEPFGDVSVGREIAYVDDTTWFYVNGDLYYDVGSLVGDVPKTCIAAMNGKDNYSYRFYSIDGTAYDGIIIMNAYSKINMVNIDRVYVCEKASYVPSSLINDFPHKDTWYDGGAIFQLQNESYCRYGTLRFDFEVGDYLFTENNVSYYQYNDESNWIMAPNENNKNYYDIFYNVDKVTSIPTSVIFSIAGRLENN